MLMEGGGAAHTLLMTSGASPDQPTITMSAGGGRGGAAGLRSSPRHAGREGLTGQLAALLRRAIACARCGCCGEHITVNRRQLRVIERIGEGGFSFVYVAEDSATRTRYAVKRMLCQTTEQAQRARREIEVQRV